MITGLARYAKPFLQQTQEMAMCLLCVLLSAATLGEAAFGTLPQVYSSAAHGATAQANSNITALAERSPGVSIW
jgi:hypothetical protein